MNTGFIDKLRAIDAVVAKYEDVTNGLADTVLSECAVSAPEKMEEEIAGISADDRLLSIGIIGRVKAGKSSLLNSLFFG
ncbi:MAG: hypothetical protein J6333_00420, partial [Planctomycetes bacterium]|nr:hypothetical protein [Planctomycetota bacterium]